jgi:hypothetical protein
MEAMCMSIYFRSNYYTKTIVLASPNLGDFGLRLLRVVEFYV